MFKKSIKTQETRQKCVLSTKRFRVFLVICSPKSLWRRQTGNSLSSFKIRAWLQKERRDNHRNEVKEVQWRRSITENRRSKVLSYKAMAGKQKLIYSFIQIMRAWFLKRHNVWPLFLWQSPSKIPSYVSFHSVGARKLWSHHFCNWSRPLTRSETNQ